MIPAVVSGGIPVGKVPGFSDQKVSQIMSGIMELFYTFFWYQWRTVEKERAVDGIILRDDRVNRRATTRFRNKMTVMR